jgi:hypothetical protein
MSAMRPEGSVGHEWKVDQFGAVREIHSSGSVSTRLTPSGSATSDPGLSVAEFDRNGFF